jgi:hypothetical protein
VDDLSQGINPFCLTRRNYIADLSIGEDAQELAYNYDTVLDGASTSLADAKALKQSKIVLPMNLWDVKGQIVAMFLVWVTLLGDHHPFVTSLGRFSRPST